MDADHAAVPSDAPPFICVLSALPSFPHQHNPFCLTNPPRPPPSLPDTCIWMLFFDDVAPHTLRRLAEEGGVNASRLRFSPFFEKMLELPTKNMCGAAAGGGAGLTRVTLMPNPPPSLRCRCDLFLDTPAFVAHTTGSDALWAGLPFVTIAGHDFAARVAAGLAVAVGMPHMIARGESE